MHTQAMLALLFVPFAWGPGAMSPQLYEIRTETVMPHLEENLRYATTHETRCLARSELIGAFPVMRHPALAGCRLQSDAPGTHVLICDDASRATGRASWIFGERQLQGTLEVKLGGKNMTFQQRIVARARGACARDR